MQALGEPGCLAVRAAVAAGLEAVVVDDRDGGLGVLLRLPACVCVCVCVCACVCVCDFSCVCLCV